jgi:hypothetical protein
MTSNPSVDIHIIVFSTFPTPLFCLFASIAWKVTIPSVFDKLGLLALRPHVGAAVCSSELGVVVPMHACTRIEIVQTAVELSRLEERSS